MPVGTCDPATRGNTWNDAELAMFNNTVRVIYQYGWDGVSTRTTGCVGPIQKVQVINTSPTKTYYAWFFSKTGIARSIPIEPGLDRTFNKGQSGSRGFDTNADIDGVTITETDVSPF